MIYRKCRPTPYKKPYTDNQYTIKKINTIMAKAPRESWEYKFTCNLNLSIIKYGDKTRFSEKQIEYIDKYYNIYKNSNELTEWQILKKLIPSDELYEPEYIVEDNGRSSNIRLNPKWKGN